QTNALGIAHPVFQQGESVGQPLGFNPNCRVGFSLPAASRLPYRTDPGVKYADTKKAPNIGAFYNYFFLL
ncbi:hypothetical protein, partial [Pontibacterium sp.]|uniref:hypothetical protein n=1 Tax=Pontibacterium sp. TaxID=2036026 RepID=UPI003562C049